MKVLVAGYGNPFREDDRLGHELAPLVCEFLISKGEDLRDKDIAIFIDASAEGLPEGFLLEVMKPDPNIEGLNIHSMGPAWVLHLMESLKIPYPETLLLSVSGHSFDFKEEMTPICRERMERALHSFKELWEKRYSPC